MIAELKPLKVYIACLDPFAKVNGKGVEILREAGIEVEIGLLEKEAVWLKPSVFYTYWSIPPLCYSKMGAVEGRFYGDAK